MVKTTGSDVARSTRHTNVHIVDQRDAVPVVGQPQLAGGAGRGEHHGVALEPWVHEETRGGRRQGPTLNEPPQSIQR